jgi:hypothetical protein
MEPPASIFRVEKYYTYCRTGMELVISRQKNFKRTASTLLQFGEPRKIKREIH